MRRERCQMSQSSDLLGEISPVEQLQIKRVDGIEQSWGDAGKGRSAK